MFPLSYHNILHTALHATEACWTPLLTYLVKKIPDTLGAQALKHNWKIFTRLIN